MDFLVIIVLKQNENIICVENYNNVLERGLNCLRLIDPLSFFYKLNKSIKSTTRQE